MTREERWIVSLDEIQAIRWECGNCHVAMSFQMNQSIKLPTDCPSCRARLVDPEFHRDHQMFQSFVQVLKAVMVTKPHPEGNPRLSLEFLRPPER